MDVTGWSKGLDVSADGRGIVSHAGLARPSDNLPGRMSGHLHVCTPLGLIARHSSCGDVSSAVAAMAHCYPAALGRGVCGAGFFQSVSRSSGCL